jgi:hypothetical protein
MRKPKNPGRIPIPPDRHAFQGSGMRPSALVSTLTPNGRGVVIHFVVQTRVRLRFTVL